MNCSVIEMGQVSYFYMKAQPLLLHFGYKSECSMLKRNRGSCSNMSDQETDGI